MKRFLLLSTLLLAGFIAFSQNRHNSKQSVKASKPDVHYKVNKVYDSHGNLIRYDSVYSYQSKGLQAMAKADSLFHRMMPGNMMPGMGAAFSNISDSAMMANFFNQPGFSAGWQSAMKQMRHEMQAMDSMNQAFMEHYMKGQRIKSPKKAGIDQ
jgi:hypothetical protein